MGNMRFATEFEILIKKSQNIYAPLLSISKNNPYGEI